MGLFNHFPYPDTHQLNLDWILEAVRGCVNKVEESEDVIQKALTDAQAAATTAETSATSAQEGAENAQTSVTQAQTYANNAQTSANNAREDANTCAEYAAQVQAMMGKLYPVGAIYYNATTPSESDATVIARLQALTGGTWAMASIYGDPVQDPNNRGWVTFTLKNAANNSATFNCNIYIRTA